VRGRVLGLRAEAVQHPPHRAGGVAAAACAHRGEELVTALVRPVRVDFCVGGPSVEGGLVGQHAALTGPDAPSFLVVVAVAVVVATRHADGPVAFPVSVRKKALRAARRRVRRYRHERTPIHPRHERRLHRPVLARVLDDAERVDPEILHP